MISRRQIDVGKSKPGSLQVSILALLDSAWQVPPLSRYYVSRDTALALGQVSTKYPSRCRPQKNQIIHTIRYRPSVKCRLFTYCPTLLSAAARLTAHYDQYYHRLVPGGNVFSHVCPGVEIYILLGLHVQPQLQKVQPQCMRVQPQLGQDHLLD